MRMLFRVCGIVLFAISSAGCADILPWPGFESTPAATSYSEQIPASLIGEQVRCEIAEYIGNDNDAAILLNPDKGAQVQLKLSTDLQGSVTYLGINLSGLGLGALASLVSQSNNVPTLQLKGQGKSTVTSQIDFVVPQSHKYSFKTKDAHGHTIAVDLPTDVRLPKNCNTAGITRKAQDLWFRLWLNEALNRYSQRLNAAEEKSGTFLTHVCDPKLTISTQFQLLFDISAGTNVFNSFPVLLPISGLSVDASPDYTHFLQIGFTLNGAKGYEPACQVIRPTNAPSRI